MSTKLIDLIFKFYEGTDKSLFTPATAENFNKNPKLLAEAIDSISDKLKKSSDKYLKGLKLNDDNNLILTLNDGTEISQSLESLFEDLERKLTEVENSKDSVHSEVQALKPIVDKNKKDLVQHDKRLKTLEGNHDTKTLCLIDSI